MGRERARIINLCYMVASWFATVLVKGELGGESEARSRKRGAAGKAGGWGIRQAF